MLSTYLKACVGFFKRTEDWTDQDLARALYDVVSAVVPPGATELRRGIKGWKKDTAQADMLVAGLTDLAQSHAPPFTVFGASPDGEWGCWFCVGSYQEAIYDGDVALCIDGDVEAVALANPDADYVSLVSDHGNVELFCAGTLREEGSQAASIYGVV